MMISLLDCRYQGEGKYSVRFSDGTEGSFDLNRYLQDRQGPLLAPLGSDEFRQRAFIEAGALAWPNGLEISPARIREYLTKNMPQAA